MQVENRTRYNFWDLLSDMGGLNDGMMLLGALLVGSYASLAF